ncbi:MAG: nucleotidyltransferase family protein [Nocardioidaceae bacterium]
MRVLFMKGPVLAAQGLRPARVSIDVDVLVDPAAMRRLCSALEQLGWCVPVASTTARIVPQHSATYAHEAWPCTVDVHHRFPGFLAGPQVVFEALWARRTTANVAGREVPCCDVLGSAAILALHALRDPSRPHLQSELAHLVDVLNASIDDAGRAELAQLTAMTGASATLEPFLDAVGAPRTGREVVDSPELKAWRIRTAATGVKSVAWLAELSRTPLRRWIPTLWRAVTLTEAEIRHTYPEAAPGSWGLLGARMRRLRRGLVDLPKAARIVWRSGIASHPAGGRR